ncbi:proline-rich receptor-like protein kinase PERK9 [Iris pallida]|uniref:Proline-rich receptor-like protein kinase PERK9 n=1 Tax=Iris pallida TaxID=29817 RepID=A0AAX6HXU7_IRIPA|nr:proline-rich receptor-like protein kinase PERK9 [Iris pallida]
MDLLAGHRRRASTLPPSSHGASSTVGAIDATPSDLLFSHGHSAPNPTPRLPSRAVVSKKIYIYIYIYNWLAVDSLSLGSDGNTCRQKPRD